MRAPGETPPAAAEPMRAAARPPAGQASCRGAADGQPVHAQGRLADAHRHALAVLAASADPAIEREIIADHGDLRQRIGTVADEGRALYRLAELAVLNEIGFGRREHEL